MNMAHNKLQIISKDIFNPLYELKYLNLEYNRIIEFNQFALDDSRELRKVCLYENPIDKYLKPQDICSALYNPECEVYINTPCKFETFNSYVTDK